MNDLGRYGDSDFAKEVEALLREVCLSYACWVRTGDAGDLSRDVGRAVKLLDLELRFDD